MFKPFGHFHALRIGDNPRSESQPADVAELM
jgi:hypothetical protein